MIDIIRHAIMPSHFHYVRVLNKMRELLRSSHCFILLLLNKTSFRMKCVLAIAAKL